MAKDFTPAVRQGKTEEQITKIQYSRPLLKPTPVKDIEGTITVVCASIANNESVSDDTLIERLENRYRKGDSLKALRIVHQRFPNRTRLVLERGIYTLYPTGVRV